MKPSKSIKEKYNYLLFKRYGFRRGALFENIPFALRVLPLFSPSLFAKYEGEQMVKSILDGLESASEETCDMVARHVDFMEKGALKDGKGD